MISYAQKIFDSDMCSHSIDNLVIEYYVDSFSADRVMDSLAEIFSSCVPDWDREKCTRDDLPACSKYQYFKHTIWGGGFHVSYGHYKGFDKVDRTWDVLPVIRFKFNPNKWMRGSLFDALHSWIRERCDNGVLLKYDYAIDVPCRLCDLAVDSRKEPGLYKGTRYYGQRNQHGRLKIYDKKTESAADVPDDMTRVEWTFALGVRLHLIRSFGSQTALHRSLLRRILLRRLMLLLVCCSISRPLVALWSLLCSTLTVVLVKT